MTTKAFAEDMRQQLLQPAWWTQGVVHGEEGKLLGWGDQTDVRPSTSVASAILSSLERAGEFDFLKGDVEDIYDLSDGEAI